MGSVSLQAGTSSSSDPQLDPKRIKLDSGELLLELVGHLRVVRHKLLLLGVGKSRRAVGQGGRILDMVGELSTLRLWLVVPPLLACAPEK